MGCGVKKKKNEREKKELRELLLECYSALNAYFEVKRKSRVFIEEYVDDGTLGDLWKECDEEIEKKNTRNLRMQ